MTDEKDPKDDAPRPISFSHMSSAIHFAPCEQCGVETQLNGASNHQCWDCMQAAARRSDDAERIRAAFLGWPVRFQWASFRSPDLSLRVKDIRAIEAAKASVDAQHVVFIGPSAKGKTSLATALLRAQSIARRIPGVFCDSCEAGPARLRHKGDGEPWMVTSAMRDPLVLVDGVGDEIQIPTNSVPDIIGQRHNRDLPTIYTVGLTREALCQRYGDGTARRVFDGAVVIQVRS